MKKLRKVKTNLQDSIEAYEGACTCSIGCSCVVCGCPNNDLSIDVAYDPTYENTESTSLSISLSHYSWA